ncbi:MAG: M6 family metalloprotease domain-containing protein [Fibrobacter sp.]|nr:M6 family metalloprotease domain-containing protein [Fibrobacter sp.]
MSIWEKTVLLATALVGAIWAAPASNRYYTVTQPDGSTIQVKDVGDEKHHYKVTSDGKILEDGAFEQIHFTQDIDLSREYIPQPLRMPALKPVLNSGEKRALVILVQFKDIQFSVEKPEAFFSRFLNEEDFHDYNNQGSVKDYFTKNSKGAFIPTYDVVGPVTLSKDAATGYGPKSIYGDAGAAVALMEALDTLMKWGTIDFNKYDQDGDHYLDFVHMIYAGPGASDSGVETTIWPHMWYIPNRKQVTRTPKYYVQPYACTAELDGMAYTKGKKIPAGVGTFIHEFSHILGLADIYSSDESLFTPGNWDVMDLGSYNCYYNEYPVSCTPPNLSAFEKISLGWLKATELTKSGPTNLYGIDSMALQVTNPENRDEFYLMEYRSPVDFDIGLPNHGMLIWHIDYNKNIWDSAKVNTPERMHVDLIEADGKGSFYNITTDVFPGTGRNKVSRFDKFIMWDKTDMEIALTDITEDSGYRFVSFNASLANEILSSSSEEISSSSETEESSSSEEAVSSSSEEPELSSSSESREKSSSSENLEVSSSSETELPPEESSSSDESQILVAQRANNVNVALRKNTLSVQNLPKGNSKLHLVSPNGNLLMSRNLNESSVEIQLQDVSHPFIIHITHQGKPFYTKAIR